MPAFRAGLRIFPRQLVTISIRQIGTPFQKRFPVDFSLGIARFQDIQRSAESSRFERASYLLGGTAALLAGISLFNSLLDIWSLSLENSGWLLPASWLRILLALAASAAIPLAATWFIARKKAAAWLALLVSLAALAGMLLSTILVNR